MPLPTSPDSSPAPLVDRRSFVKIAALAGASALARPVAACAPAPPTRVLIWSEGTAPKGVYPNDVNGALGDDLRRRDGLAVSLARLGDVDSGLSDETLDSNDTLIWWGRLRHDDLPEARAKAIADRVRAGKLGFVALHASYASKPFRTLLGAACAPKAWREDGQPEKVEVKAPDHPIARGIAGFTIPKTATFTEPFTVPEPEAVVFVSRWEKGESFRSGLTWTVGKGRVAYFRPGHDGYPILFHPTVRQVIANAARWSAPSRESR
jgi:trehalose utilization protein